MAETKYNLLTRLLKNIKNVVNPDGSLAGSGGGSTGGGVLVVHEDENGTLDKTWQEIYDAGFAVILAEGGKLAYLAQLVQGQAYGVIVFDPSNMNTFAYIASSPDGYPVYYNNGGGGSDLTPV